MTGVFLKIGSLRWQRRQLQVNFQEKSEINEDCKKLEVGINGKAEIGSLKITEKLHVLFVFKYM